MTKIELARDILVAMIGSPPSQIISMVSEATPTSNEEREVKMARIAAKAAKVLLEESES